MSEQNSSKTTQLPLTENENLLAHQPETVETSVPAASPDLAGGQPDFITCPNCFTTDCSPSGELKPVRDFICNVCGVDFTPENEPSTDSVDKTVQNWLAKYYPKADMRKQILRTERRLKNSRVKGLSS